MRKKTLSLLEKLADHDHIDLYYGDQTGFSEQGYVPYGWQFDDESVFIPVCRGKFRSCFGLLSRDNRLIWRTSDKCINAEFVIETLDELSLSIKKQTVVVLDNASIHTARKVKELFKVWQKRGLYIFYLPPYSPHLNIIERLWKEIKQGWIRPEDYQSPDSLFYAVNRICAAVGTSLFIKFSSFNI